MREADVFASSARNGKALMALSVAAVPSEPVGRARVRWTQLHAAWMLLALGVGLAFGCATCVACACAGSLACRVWLQRDVLVSWRAFGAANSVTSLRVALLVLMGWSLDQRAAQAAALTAMLMFVLDGLDGWLARRTQQASAFGAHYDMETDACFVLMLSLGVTQLGRTAAWVTIAGALRYLYVLGLWLTRRAHADAPRTEWGRYVFALVVLSFTGSLWPLTMLMPWLPAGATLLLVASFARSFAWSLRAPANA